MDISKKDWKLFREKLPDWQENYMDKLNKQYIELLSNEKETASDKFWELAKRINPGVIMDMRKSEAIWNIINLIRLNVITHDDLEDFSDDLKQAVDFVLWRSMD